MIEMKNFSIKIVSTNSINRIGNQKLVLLNSEKKDMKNFLGRIRK